MKNLRSFLYPKKKENLKFVLSDAFIDDDGKPIEWEIRQLTAKEGIEARKQLNQSDDIVEQSLGYLAEAVVYPDLHDKELLDGISEIIGHKVLSAKDVLLYLLDDDQIIGLVSTYLQYSAIDRTVDELAANLKN